MRGNTFLRGMAAAGVALGGYIAVDSCLDANVWMSSAQAKEFFTRKRINGQWITGVFPAEPGSQATHVHRRPRFVARHVRPAARKVATETAKVISPAAMSFDPPARPAGDVASVGPDPATDRGANAASPEPSTATGTTPSVATAAPTGDAASERLTRLHAALVARAQELATSGAGVPSAFVSGTLPPPATPAVAAGVAPTPPTAPVRPVEITAQPGGAGPDKVAARSEDAPKVLEPKAVSYDFETGVKTTTFANSVVREPFDVAAMKRIAVPTASR